MNNGIQINFDIANNVSSGMTTLEDELKQISSSFSTSLSSLNKIGNSHISSTTNIASEISKSFSLISDNLKSIHDSFDSTIESYYQVENEVETRDTTNISSVISTIGYRWKNAVGGQTVGKMSSEEISSALAKKGWTDLGGGKYQSPDGKYTYYSSLGKIRSGGVEVLCNIYKNSSNTDNIKSSITFLGGQGERQSGSNAGINGKLSSDDNAIVIAPYTGVDKALSPNQVTMATQFADAAFGIKSSQNHSIVGFSEGGQVASNTVSQNKGMYNDVVMINSSTMTKNAKENVIKGDYSAFNGTNVTYVVCKGGWGDDNKSVVKSIDNLIQNGVNSNNITLVTNDSSLVSTVTGSGIKVDQSMPNNFASHKDGWKIVEQLNL